MQILMVRTAEGDSELIADFTAERLRLGKFEMMGIGGCLPANDAGLLAYKPKMHLTALARLLWEGHSAFCLGFGGLLRRRHRAKRQGFCQGL